MTCNIQTPWVMHTFCCLQSKQAETTHNVSWVGRERFKWGETYFPVRHCLLLEATAGCIFANVVRNRLLLYLHEVNTTTTKDI